MAGSQPQSHAGPGNGSTQGGSEWRYGSLLFWGFFGRDTPEGRRFGRETTGWLALLALAAVTASVGWLPAATLGVGLPVVVLGIAWSYARYLSRLDELSRRIQMDSFAVSYGVAMVIGAVLAGWGLVNPEGVGAISPAAVFVVLACAEVVRGVVLVRLARRYR